MFAQCDVKTFYTVIGAVKITDVLKKRHHDMRVKDVH